jgi:hypothetical protein
MSKKLTKKQKKIMKGLNAASRRSVHGGQNQNVIYKGLVPQFREVRSDGPLMPAKWVKISNGLPFINLTLRPETNLYLTGSN